MKIYYNNWIFKVKVKEINIKKIRTLLEHAMNNNRLAKIKRTFNKIFQSHQLNNNYQITMTINKRKTIIETMIVARNQQILI